MFPFSIHQ